MRCPQREADTPRAAGTAKPTELGWRGLTYRWFAEYNAMYLLSAALVLLGMILASRGLDEEWTLARAHRPLRLAADRHLGFSLDDTLGGGGG